MTQPHDLARQTAWLTYCDQVMTRLLKEYGLILPDILDEDQMYEAFNSGETVQELLDRLELKYDLEPLSYC